MNRVLEEIRDNQRLQLERQDEALKLQHEQCALIQKQTERTERIQDRAEQIQAKSAQLITRSRTGQIVALIVIITVIAYVSWFIFRLTAR
jgi:uncharacterized membrane protein (DUF106 family)